MSCSLTLSFDTYDDLVEFTSKFKSFQEKQFKKKEKKFVETYSDLTEMMIKMISLTVEVPIK